MNQKCCKKCTGFLRKCNYLAFKELEGSAICPCHEPSKEECGHAFRGVMQKGSRCLTCQKYIPDPQPKECKHNYIHIEKENIGYCIEDQTDGNDVIQFIQKLLSQSLTSLLESLDKELEGKKKNIPWNLPDLKMTSETISYNQALSLAQEIIRSKLK